MSAAIARSSIRPYIVRLVFCFLLIALLIYSANSYAVFSYETVLILVLSTLAYATYVVSAIVYAPSIYLTSEGLVLKRMFSEQLIPFNRILTIKHTKILWLQYSKTSDIETARKVLKNDIDGRQRIIDEGLLRESSVDKIEMDILNKEISEMTKHIGHVMILCNDADMAASAASQIQSFLTDDTVV